MGVGHWHWAVGSRQWALGIVGISPWNPPSEYRWSPRIGRGASASGAIGGSGTGRMPMPAPEGDGSHLVRVRVRVGVGVGIRVGVRVGVGVGVRVLPSTKAALALKPICVAMAMKTSEVSRNWPDPRMKASRPTLLSL